MPFSNKEDLGFIRNVVEDLTPELGANLDAKEFDLDNVGDLIHDDAVGSDLTIKNIDLDKDIKFSGNDGSVQTDIMILDVSAGQLTGIMKATTGVLGTATDGTDYLSSLAADASPELAAALGAGGFNIVNAGDVQVESISSSAGTSIAITLGADAGDDLLVGTNKLVVEGDTGFVGVGTTTPRTKLEVASPAAAVAETALTISNANATNYSTVIMELWSRGGARGKIAAEQNASGTDGSLQLFSYSGAAFVENARLKKNESVFNEGSADVDFRVESDGNENMLFVNAGDNKVGIGTSTPAEVLDVVGSIQLTKTIYQDVEIDNGNSGSTKTIDWTAGNNQKITMTDNCTFTFTAPAGACHVQLRSIQDAGGTNTYTWTGGGLAINWVDATEPTWSVAANAVNIHNFYFDGAAWWGAGGKFAAA